MTTGQWRVLGLLVLLLGLEIIRSPSVKGFFTNLIPSGGGGGILSNIMNSQSANVPGKQPIQTVKPDPNTLKCPSGTTAYRASGGNIVCVKTGG